MSESKKEEIDQHKNGVTAVSIAAQAGHYSTVEALVTAGADINLLDEDGSSPLISSFKQNHNNITIYLLEHGANPNDNYKNDKGISHNLLMESILTNKTKVALSLISHGADITFLDTENVSLITQAAYLGYFDIFEALLSKNADISISNKEGINPLIAAASEGHIAIVQLILKQSNVDANAKDNDGTSALMAAAVRGHDEVVKILLEHNVDINSQNIDGHTALMFAYNGKNQVETLLDKYSEYIKDDQDNSTKLIVDALKSHVTVISLLLQHGADPAIKVL
jgi:ankyrin repeat protein